MNLNLQHPWQSGPAELITYAVTHLHKDTDFDRRLAFLLLDVGIETLFKTYLTLPDKVTGAQGSYTERRKATEGNFHELVAGVEKAAQNQIRGFNFSHIQYFHDLRNKLYHQGNGITIPFEQVHQYANLSVQLLAILLEVDLSRLVSQPQLDAAERNQRQVELESRKRDIEFKVISINKARERLEIVAKNALEIIDYRLVLPSFERYFDQLTSRGFFIDDGWHPVFINKLSKHLADGLDLVELAEFTRQLLSAPDNITEFYLHLLQFIAANPKDVDFRGYYVMSRYYSELAQQPELVITGGDPINPISEYIFPAHSAILQYGTEWIEDLEYIHNSIETWIKESVK